MSMASQYPALFGLHGDQEPPEAQAITMPAWLEDLPPGPDKAAAAALWELVLRHPVRVFRLPGKSLVVGIEAEPAWRSANGELWDKAYGLWRAALACLVRAYGDLPEGARW